MKTLYIFFIWLPGFLFLAALAGLGVILRSPRLVIWCEAQYRKQYVKS